VRICVVGAGMAGVLIARLAETAGARARIVNRDAGRLDFLTARRMLPAGGGALLSSARPAAYDVAVVATSFVLPELLDRALGLVRPGGIVMLYGGTAAGDRLPGLDCDLDRIRRSELAETAEWRGAPVRVGGSYGTTGEDFRHALDTLAGAPDGLGVERLIAGEVALPELPEAFRRLAGGRWFGKVLIRP
jgi:cyclitol reductase